MFESLTKKLLRQTRHTATISQTIEGDEVHNNHKLNKGDEAYNDQKLDEGDEAHSNHKPDEGDEAYRHIVTTSQLKRRGILYLSVVGHGSLNHLQKNC